MPSLNPTQPNYTGEQSRHYLAIHSSTPRTPQSQADRITWTVGTKTKKHRKRKTADKLNINGGIDKLNGANDQEHVEPDDEEVEEPETPIDVSHAGAHLKLHESTPNGLHTPTTNGFTKLSTPRDLPKEGEDILVPTTSQNDSLPEAATNDNSLKFGEPMASLEDTEARLEALAMGRNALGNEVAQLRKSLEEIQGKHLEELASLREQLEDTQGEKEHAETQYRNLLGKVNTIKSQLGERLKADAVSVLVILTWPYTHGLIGGISPGPKPY